MPFHNLLHNWLRPKKFLINTHHLHLPLHKHFHTAKVIAMFLILEYR